MQKIKKEILKMRCGCEYVYLYDTKQKAYVFAGINKICKKHLKTWATIINLKTNC